MLGLKGKRYVVTLTHPPRQLATSEDKSVSNTVWGAKYR